MRYQVIGWFLFFMTLFSGNPLRAEEWFITSGRGLGSIAIGEPMEKVVSRFGVAKDTMGSLYWYKDKGLEFYAPENLIERIIIVKSSFGDISYVTPCGVSVGSFACEVERAYGPCRRALFSKHVYTLDYVEKGITFYIRGGEVCKIQLYRATGSAALGGAPPSL
ncbi:MAG: hypothetical protein RDV48_09130 [Candidatus Eremiobacteraeota bacterium]|nr:hypothetical protein [Candidatus Eremiobacteraeota bacterium]